MKKCILFLVLGVPIFSFSQWSKTEVKPQQIVNVGLQKVASADLYSLDIIKLTQKLTKTSKRAINSGGIIMEIPTKEGKMEKFEVWEYSNMEPELQAKFPDIRAFVGKSLDHPGDVIRFSSSPQGFSSMVVRSGISEYIEPYTTDARTYIVFDSNSRNRMEDHLFTCSTKEASHLESRTAVQQRLPGFNTFRLALSCTGEYAQYYLTKANLPSTATDQEKKAVVLAAFNATLTRLNGIFEKDLSLHYNLIAETESLIFLNPSADPYTNGGPDESNTAINASLAPNASSKFDLGHLLDKRDANGEAYVAVLCGNSMKAGGWTAHNVPEGASFDVDYVAHEMGHQMGAGHTYTYSTKQQDQTVEPGSGSTIMAYTGITGNFDVQYTSQDNYHYKSIGQIRKYIGSLNCGENIPFDLSKPVLEAGPDYNIPKSTPFIVRAFTTDEHSEAYTYSVEQIDQAASAQMASNSITYATKPTGPNFRAFPPVKEPYRYFPAFNTVLAGVNTTRWESLSSVDRSLTFGITLRNNNPLKPNVAQDSMRVSVKTEAGPFMVTAPSFGQTLFSGKSFTVTWDVAGTDKAPINTSNVTIKFSADGGKTFSILKAETPNDGSENIILPAGSQSPNAFFMIEAVGNIYFAVSPSFVVDYTVDGKSCITYSYTGSPVAISDGVGGHGISSPKVASVISVPVEGVVTDLKVTPRIVHGAVSQLSFGIESPTGSTALLMNHQCGSRSGITATFADEGNNLNCNTSPVSGTVKPFESLAVFKGHNTKGDWKLFASDNYSGTIGSIEGWDLELCTRNQEQVNLGVNEDILSSNIKIYPNPGNGIFFVKTKGLTGRIELSLYDLSGKQVFVSVDHQQAEQTTRQYQVNLPSGLYIIKVKSDEGVHTQKLIIQ